MESHITEGFSKSSKECRRALIAKTCGLPAFFLFTCLATIQKSWESAARDGGVVRLHVKEGYVFTPPKRVTSPTWGPPPLCKQALTVMERTHPFYSCIILCLCSLESNAFYNSYLTLRYVTSLRDSFCLETFAHSYIILPPHSLESWRDCSLAIYF